MSDGIKRFAVVRLPKDTAKMIDELVDAAAKWGITCASDAGSENEREKYQYLCFARKWLSEHIEMLCEEAGVEPSGDDQIMRYL